MRRTTPVVMAATLLAAACPGKRSAAPTSATPPSQSSASIDDPESYLINKVPRARGDKRDALRNENAKPIVIRGGTVLTADGKRFERGLVVLSGGRIDYVGAESKQAPAGAHIIDATGLFVTPGLIDTHSHIGVYASPNVDAHSDGNEMVGPSTPYARAEWGYWPQDPAISRALAGGVTAALVLPGSANIIGGRGFSVVMRRGTRIEDVMFPGAPPTVKMACGENPKRVYGQKGGPMTRMAIYAKFRAAFEVAMQYAAKRKRYASARAKWNKRNNGSNIEGKDKQKSAPEPPPFDLGLDTLAAVLSGDVLVQIHCYKASELAEMVAIADEYKFRIRSFHHALGAYKVRDLLVARGIAISTWADWWGFKMEAFDGIPENAALFSEAGGRPVIHSDSSVGIQRLNQEAAKAMYSGRRAGIKVSENEALRWVTANPAWVLGIDDVTGTLAAGKRADVVVWTGSPFSVYSLPKIVIQGGDVVHRLADGPQPSDFELGNSAIDQDSAAPRGRRSR